MARSLRIEFPGGLYHVTARGNGRLAIFVDNSDRERFLAVLASNGLTVVPQAGFYKIVESQDIARQLTPIERGALPAEERERWITNARAHFDRLLEEREEEWERAVARSRDDELARLGAFYTARIEEEEERLRRRTGNGEEAEIEEGDATSLKLEWERRAAEVRQRWALRTEVRLWGVVEWSWPMAILEQELRSGAVHVRVSADVDVARGRPSLPPCPGCGRGAELLVRARGGVGCEHCADHRA